MAIPMNVFSSNDETSDNEDSFSACRQTCSRATNSKSKLVLVVSTLVALVILIPIVWMRHHKHNCHSMETRMKYNGGMMSGNDNGMMMGDSFPQDVVVMEYIDPPFEEDIDGGNDWIVEEEEEWSVDEAVEEDVDVNDASLFDESDEEQEEAVDEPLEFFASVESSSDEEDGMVEEVERMEEEGEGY